MTKKIMTRAAAYAMGVSSAVATLLLAASAHAQVTFSATGPQTAIQTVYDGALNFFYTNAPAIILTVVALSLAVAFISLISRKLRGATRGV